jgi:hypothetical protein
MINMVMHKIINWGVALKSFSISDLRVGYPSKNADSE